MIRWFAPAPLFSLLAALATGQNNGSGWKLETLHLKSGSSMPGYFSSEDNSLIYFQCVVVKAGSPTLIFHHAFEKKEVQSIEKLPQMERDNLKTRLENLVKERQRLTATLRALDPKTKDTEIVPLEEGKWREITGGSAWIYPSRFFLLESNAKKGMAQLAAIQMEMAFTAYAQTLPLRLAGPKPRVLFFRSLNDYHAALKTRGLKLDNPAFYNAKENEILCGSDFERLLEEKEKLDAFHNQLLGDLKKKETELKEIYKNRVPPDLLLPFAQSRKKISVAAQGNEATVRQARDQLFQQLYHEAFHAYLACNVYPPEAAFPRWLNEGLAQIFESAVFEVGELRVGHVNKDRLDSLRQAVAKKTLPPLKDLLLSKPAQFLVTHEAARDGSNRFYLASWALAFHLAFEKKLLGKPALDDYVASLKKGADPILAFEKLIDQPLSAFEPAFNLYLRGLRSDGSSKPPL